MLPPPPVSLRYSLAASLLRWKQASIPEACKLLFPFFNTALSFTDQLSWSEWWDGAPRAKARFEAGSFSTHLVVALPRLEILALATEAQQEEIVGCRISKVQPLISERLLHVSVRQPLRPPQLKLLEATIADLKNKLCVLAAIADVTWCCGAHCMELWLVARSAKHKHVCAAVRCRYDLLSTSPLATNVPTLEDLIFCAMGIGCTLDDGVDEILDFNSNKLSTQAITSLPNFTGFYPSLTFNGFEKHFCFPSFSVCGSEHVKKVQFSYFGRSLSQDDLASITRIRSLVFLDVKLMPPRGGVANIDYLSLVGGCTSLEALTFAPGGYSSDSLVGPFAHITALDLSSCRCLAHIGDHFLQHCAIARLLLPPAIQTIGDFFLAGATDLVELDLRHTELERIGANFCAQHSSLERCFFPPSLRFIGARFMFSGSKLASIDLAQCSRLEVIEPEFCNCTDELTSVLLPPSLRVIGAQFLCGAVALSSLDLSSSTLEVIPNDFCRRALSLVSCQFPRTVKLIGDNCFRDSGLETLEGVLSHLSNLLSIGNNFATFSHLSKATLSDTHILMMPASLKEIGHDFLQWCSWMINFSRCSRLQRIGPCPSNNSVFLWPPHVEQGFFSYCVYDAQIDWVDKGLTE